MARNSSRALLVFGLFLGSIGVIQQFYFSNEPASDESSKEVGLNKAKVIQLGAGSQKSSVAVHSGKSLNMPSQAPSLQRDAHAAENDSQGLPLSSWLMKLPGLEQLAKSYREKWMDFLSNDLKMSEVELQNLVQFDQETTQGRILAAKELKSPTLSEEERTQKEQALLSLSAKREEERKQLLIGMVGQDGFDQVNHFQSRFIADLVSLRR